MKRTLALIAFAMMAAGCGTYAASNSTSVPREQATVTADGATPVAEGLLAPFALAKGPDGDLYVSFGTIAFFPGAPAGVVKIEAAG